MAIHKGTELNNVNETWNQNERLREGNEQNPGLTNVDDGTGAGSALDQTIKKEASEYDNANKDERVLDGERATVNDNPDNIETMK